MLPILSAIIPIIGDVLDRLIPDKTERDRLEAELLRQIMAQRHEMEAAAAEVVRAEIGGESWLQRSWRPITMLTFLACVVGYWFGFTPDTLTDRAIDGMFTLIQIGLGGYVIGRSAEKIVRELPARDAGALAAWRASR